MSTKTNITEIIEINVQWRTGFVQFLFSDGLKNKFNRSQFLTLFLFFFAR